MVPWFSASAPDGGLLDAAGDAVAVQRAHRGQGLEHHQVERAVGDFRVGQGTASSSCRQVNRDREDATGHVERQQGESR